MHNNNNNNNNNNTTTTTTTTTTIQQKHLKMCVQRYEMLKNIESLPIEQCFAYLLSLTKMYLVIFVIQAIIFFSDGGQNAPPSSAGPTEAKLICYVLLSTCCGLTYIFKSLFWSTITTIIAGFVTIISIIILIIGLMQKNYFALIILISIFLSSTTVYLMYKTREKLANGPLSNTGNAVDSKV